MKNKNYDSAEEFDLKKYYVLITRNWHWFVLSFVVCLPIAFIVNRYSNAAFSTYSTILVKDQTQYQSSVNDVLQQLTGNKSQNKKNLITELGVLQSLYLTRKTIEKLDFRISYFREGRFSDVEVYKESPFRITLDPMHEQKEYFPIKLKAVNDSICLVTIEDSVVIKRKIKFGSWLLSPDFSFKVDKSKVFDSTAIGVKYFFEINNLEKVAQQFRSGLKVELSDEDASIIVLSEQGNLVFKNIDFLNQLAIEYIQDGLDDKNQIAQNTIDFIDLQLNRIDDSLQIAEGNLQSFRQNNKIIDLSKEGTALFDKLEGYQTERTQIDVKLKYYNYLLNYIDKRNDFKDIITPSIMGINDQLLNKLVTDLSSWNQEKKVLEYSSKANNPQIDVLNVRIKNTVESLLEVVTNIIQGAKIEKAAIDSKINQINAEVEKLPSTERNMISIKRKFELNDNIYNFLQQKRAEAGIASASNISDCKVLDWASEANTHSVSTKKVITYLLALILALLIPATIIIILDARNKTIGGISEIEQETNLDILATIPHNFYYTALVAHEYPQTIVAEYFRKLRNCFRPSSANSQATVITVTSVYSGDGKTFTAANLATSFASAGKNVLLIDFDIINPQLKTNFDIKSEKGLFSLLTDNQPNFKAFINSTSIQNLSVIAGNEQPDKVFEFGMNQQLTALFEYAKKNFDVIVVDSAPLAMVSDSVVLFPFSDWILCVMRLNITNKNALTFISEIASKYEKSNISLVVNDDPQPYTDKSIRTGAQKYLNEDFVINKSFLARFKKPLRG